MTNTTPAPIGADAWMDPHTRDVVNAERKQSWLDHYGIGGRAKAATYTVPLVRAALASAAQPAAPTKAQVLAVTTAYEQGVGKGRDAHDTGKEVGNPYSDGWNCDHAWALGYKEGKLQAARIAAVPKAAPAQQSGEVYAELPNERAAFEALARAEWRWPDEFFWRHSQTGEYTREPAISAWMAWQAALRASRGQAPAGATPLPLLVRDIAADFGVTPVQVCLALVELGFGHLSVNMAITPDMAEKLREHFVPTAQPAPAPAMPAGWVPLTIAHEGQHPEEVAYGPQIMMNRLGKWLDRYFAMLVAAPAAAQGDAHWPQLRSALAMAMLGWGRRPDRTMETCYAALDAITEPGMPLALLRAAPDWRDAARAAKEGNT